MRNRENIGSALGGLLILSLVVAGVGFWIWSLVDAIRVPDEPAFRAGSRVWVVVIA